MFHYPRLASNSLYSSHVFLKTFLRSLDLRYLGAHRIARFVYIVWVRNSQNFTWWCLCFIGQMLVVFKSAPILKRALKVKQAMLQLYVLKLLKIQTKYLGRQWRKSNMKTMSAIYQKVRHRMNDDWAYGNGEYAWWTWNSLVWLGWLATELQGWACLCFCSTGGIHGFYVGARHSNSGLHAHSPAPKYDTILWYGKMFAYL